MAAKLAFRQINGLWEYPITRRDYKFNLHLREEGMVLDEVLNQWQ